MNKNEWKKSIGVVGRMLLAYALVFAQGAWAAQNQGNKDKASSAQKAGAQQANEKQSAVPARTAAQTQQAQGEESESAVAEEKPSGDGRHEGIKVHGHWTIEVRNPDGTVVRHLEFENSLAGGHTVQVSTPPGAPAAVFAGGAAYLSAVLAGQWTAPSSWSIELFGPGGIDNQFSAADPNAPCSQSPYCLILPPALSVTPLGTSPQFTGIQLSGSVAATQTGQIVTVATQFSIRCVTLGCISPNTGWAYLTSSTNFPGAPISVIAGQLIAVTVNISFS